jgi:hypothetical protein
MRSMVPRLALMANREDLDTISPSVRAIRRDVSGAAVGDHKLAQSASHGSPDVRMPRQDPYGVEDYGCRGTR